MVGALDLASRHTKLAATRGLQSYPCAGAQFELAYVCARADIQLEASCMPRRPLNLSYLRNLETVRLVLMQVSEDLSGFDLVP